MFTLFKRIIKSGFQIFYRNISLFGATIGVLSLMLFVLGGLFVFRVLTIYAISEIQNRIAMSIYFDTTVDEAGILKAKELLSQLPEVEKVEYISKEEAIERFKERHKNNVVLMKALEELGSNPLQASLAIKARDSSQYAAIFSFIDNAPFRNQIAKVNYLENQLVIERLNKVITVIRNGGMALSILLALISILVFFNTIRIAIYNFKDEIAVMKLVGASNNFVRGPFVVVGVLAGIIAGVISFLIFFVLMNIGASKMEAFISGLGISQIISKYYMIIALIQIGFGIGLGMLTSFLAINKYLNV
jgi:cell division transport system permease protein